MGSARFLPLFGQSLTAAHHQPARQLNQHHSTFEEREQKERHLRAPRRNSKFPSGSGDEALLGQRSGRGGSFHPNLYRSKMEGPISKFMHVQQPESYWHQGAGSAAFKSPDLIELNSDTERNNARPVDPHLNYSSSQEEAETEDDGNPVEQPVTTYDVTSNDEESCHLLQTEDDSESSHSEKAWNSSSSGSSRASSREGGGGGSDREERGELNYWDMSAEQEKYYTDQFLALQPDVAGMVAGTVAKGFFEKSKLPHAELREIWQLADVTKDGCLDLSEFKMAMHLVVLRRHGLPIPSHFYSSRQPTSASASASASAFNPSEQSPHQSNSSGKRPSKEWTTFENEPVNFSSTCDTSGLACPVPVRLKTPEDKILLASTPNSKTHQLQLKAIQRPKLSGHHPKVSTGTIAPPPPPRRKTHVRSSSLDLNRLTISSDGPLPPGVSRAPETRSFLSPSHQGGAFSVYKKPKTATVHEPATHIPSNSNPNPTPADFSEELAELKHENDLLNRVSAQLLEQLSSVQARRQSVAYKIHQLHGNLP